MVSQLLTLFITPVVYFYLDKIETMISGEPKRSSEPEPEVAGGGAAAARRSSPEAGLSREPSTSAAAAAQIPHPDGERAGRSWTPGPRPASLRSKHFVKLRNPAFTSR